MKSLSNVCREKVDIFRKESSGRIKEQDKTEGKKTTQETCYFSNLIKIFKILN